MARLLFVDAWHVGCGRDWSKRARMGRAHTRPGDSPMGAELIVTVTIVGILATIA